MKERRYRRSEDPYRALCLQLEHARTQGKLDAVVLVMSNGLLVAGSGSRDACVALAAVAPLLGREHIRTFPPPLSENDNDIEIREVPFEGETLYLASLGAGRSRRRWLTQSANGVQRILSAA